jgi:hypothetical protein
VGGLFADASEAHGLSEFLANLGADTRTPTNIFLNIPEESFVGALADTLIEDTPLTGVERSVIITAVQSAFITCGRIAPRLGTTGVAAAAVPASAPTAAAPLALQPDADFAAEPVHLNTVVDQNLRGTTRRLSYTEVRDHRLFYEAVSGCPPPDCSLPSAEQLAGLRGLLASGRVPYVDFAVWSPLGPRLARFRRTEASVLIGGAFVTRNLEAPPSFAAWEESWALFSVAMVSLNAAAPGSLNCYLAGIKQLLKLFPARWSVIAGVDLVVRSERWLRLREDAERVPPAGFSQAAPWDHVIRTSAYGQGGVSETWWTANLVLPLTVGAPLALEGLPTSSSSSAPRPPSPRSSATRAPKRARQAGTPRAISADFCQNWNNRRGACQGDGPCASGRPHRCEVCGGSHRAADVHPETVKAHRGRHPGKDRKTQPKGKGKGDRSGPADKGTSS